MKNTIICILICMSVAPAIAFAQQSQINVMSYTNPQYATILNTSQTVFARPQANINFALLQNKGESVEWKKQKALELRKVGQYVTWIGISSLIVGIVEIALVGTLFSNNNPNAMAYYLKNPGSLGGAMLATGIAFTTIGGAGIIAGGTMWGVANNRLREIYTSGSETTTTPTLYKGASVLLSQ